MKKINVRWKVQLLIISLFGLISMFPFTTLLTYATGIIESPEFEFDEIIPYIDALNIIKNGELKYAEENSVFQDAKRLVYSIRKRGIFVDAFQIMSDDLTKVPLPFIVYLQDRGWRIVCNINMDSQKITCINSEGIKEVINNSLFLKNWNSCVISKIIMNTVIFKMPYDNSGKLKREKIVIVYLNHNRYKKPEEIGALLDVLIAESKSWVGGEVVYVDELGLIPENAVEMRAKFKNISREEAFEEIKQSIFKEDEMLSKGIPITSVDIPLYRELYKHLAKHKVTSFVEDLEYKLWEFIVSFDDLSIFTMALNYFILGDFSQAIHTIKTYQKGYSTYNIEIRDSHFTSQLKEIRKKHPNAIIFTVRGLGHYGFDEALVRDGEKIQVLICGNDEFAANFAFQQFVYLLKRNNVDIEQSEEDLLLLRTFPQEILRVYLDEHFNDINRVTKISIDTVNRLNLNDLYNLAKVWKAYFVNGGYKNKSLLKFGEITYNWMKEQAFIREEDLEFLNKTN